MGAFLALFKRSEPRKPVKGIGQRITNLLACHWRGVLGVLVPVAAFSYRPHMEKNAAATVQYIWMWIFWFMLTNPVDPEVTGLIPIFAFPMGGIMNTGEVVTSYFNDGIALFIIGGMLNLLLNNSGLDKRIMLWFLCSGNECQFTAKGIVLKSSLAAYFLSMCSNRLHVTSNLTQYVTPALASLQSETSRYRGSKEPDYDKIRHVVNIAIHTSASIGSIASVHGAFATLAFRVMWYESPAKGFEYEDMFNYLNYALFAFPLSALMIIINVIYHSVLVGMAAKISMTPRSVNNLRRSILKHKSAIGKLSTHEKLSAFFMTLILMAFTLRWGSMIGNGWAAFSEKKPNVPGLKDATVAAIFCMLLHMLPMDYHFLNYFTKSKKSQMPKAKLTSGILFWKFVDKNTNYGFMFMLGAGIAIQRAAQVSGLSTIIKENLGKNFTNQPWNISILLVVIIAALLSNIMNGVATCAVFMPFVTSMAGPGAPGAWEQNAYLGALAVGVASSFGFCLPYLHTPAYFCKTEGKTPVKLMIKYSAFSVLYCSVLLWAALTFWASSLFTGYGFEEVSLLPTTTTEATTAGGGGGD